MQTSIPEFSEVQELPTPTRKMRSRGQRLLRGRGELERSLVHIHVPNILLPVLLAVSITVWFFAINTPLWLDETVSYWEISGGFAQIWTRPGTFPAYYCFLWITKTLFGSNELVLRAPSIFAMLGAVCVLYRIAQEFFENDVALIVVIIFCLYPSVVFAAIDARPYAFGVLLVNCAILSLLRWTTRQSTRYAICFGAAAAGTLYFHFLFGTILAAFALYVIIAKRKEWNLLAPQAVTAFFVFALLMLPTVPYLLYLFRTAEAHVFSAPPNLSYLTSVFAPSEMLQFLGVSVLIATATRRIAIPKREPETAGTLCLLLAFVPIGILYSVSRWTPIHVFVDRYRLVAVPGIALCWGLVMSRINSNVIRMLFCLTMVGLSAARQLDQRTHGYTWKYALEAADANTSADHASLLICSDLPEADHLPMPADVNSLSVGLFAPLSYYRVHSPVIALPRALNKEAKSQVNRFLAKNGPNRKRFLVVAFAASQQTPLWIEAVTKDSYSSRTLGVYDGVSVIEFDPQ